MLLILLLSVLPRGEPLRDRVDLVEVNHFFDEHGKRVFDQIIFFDWQPRECEHRVRAWRLLKTESQLPVRDWDRGDWRMLWTDGEWLREVRAATYRETFTQYDPEVEDRDYLPKEQRKELAKP